MEVILTGTGCPVVDPRRAGPGTLVRYGGLTLQFDAGRGTAQRLVSAGTSVESLTALFITHHHCDHLLGVDDILLSRWILQRLRASPLPVIAPEGASARFITHVLDVWEDDIAVRNEHAGTSERPGAALTTFVATDAPTEVWRSGDVVVKAILVEHPPVVPSVAYRVDSPDGSVVISGDTRVCAAVETLAAGADVVVHEVILDGLGGVPESNIISTYHSKAVELGAMATRLAIPTLVLTHLIPPPNSAELVKAFETQIAAGGYSGSLIVGEDLQQIVVGEPQVEVTAPID
ncbi:MAG: MBL fold metallo-hydrolase [Candidatus Dormibacteria bacterium]